MQKSVAKIGTILVNVSKFRVPVGIKCANNNTFVVNFKNRHLDYIKRLNNWLNHEAMSSFIVYKLNPWKNTVIFSAYPTVNRFFFWLLQFNA